MPDYTSRPNPLYTEFGRPSFYGLEHTWCTTTWLKWVLQHFHRVSDITGEESFPALKGTISNTSLTICISVSSISILHNSDKPTICCIEFITTLIYNVLFSIVSTMSRLHLWFCVIVAMWLCWNHPLEYLLVQRHYCRKIDYFFEVLCYTFHVLPVPSL